MKFFSGMFVQAQLCYSEIPNVAPLIGGERLNWMRERERVHVRARGSRDHGALPAPTLGVTTEFHSIC